MHQAGHALVSHTHTHPTWADPPDLVHLPSATRDWEITHSVELLKANGCFSDGFIYPAGQGADRADIRAILERNGIHWALRTKDNYEGTTFAEMARDPFCIPRAAGFKQQHGMRPSEYFNSILEKTVPQDDRLAIFMFHGVEDDGAWDNIPVGEFMAMLQTIKAQGLQTITNLGDFVQIPAVGTR
jgi:peptidoglycan/xylan/chitin deacetylase (PgdA/CDA1 family)